MVKNLPAMQETWVRSLGQDPLEKGMATHSSILAWRIPWIEEPDRLYSSWGHKESGHNWATNRHIRIISSGQSLSRIWLCHPTDCSTPGFPVHHQLLKLPEAHVHRISDDIQPPHPLLSPSPAAFNPSQHQGLFQWVSSLHQVARVLEFQLQHQSFQWIFRTDFF